MTGANPIDSTLMSVWPCHGTWMQCRDQKKSLYVMNGFENPRNYSTPFHVAMPTQKIARRLVQTLEVKDAGHSA